MDVTLYCENAIKIIDNSGQVDQRLTSNKLIEAWQGKGPSHSRVKGTDTATSREKLERVLAHMLLRDYIREDFHFTPYSTISYLLPGSKAGLIRSGREKVFLEMAVKAKPTTSTNKSKPNSTSPAKSQISLMKKDIFETEKLKPKLVIVNKHNSAFTNFVKATSVDGSDPTKGEDSKKLSKGGHSTLLKKSNSLNLKKRKGPITCDDTDSDELDFGKRTTALTLKKPKKSASVISVTGDSSRSVLSTMRDPIDGHGDSYCEPSTSGHVTKKRPMVIESDESGDSSISDVVNGEHKNPVLPADIGNGDTDFDPVCLLDSDSDFE